MPEFTIEFEALASASDDACRNMDEMPVEKTDDQPRPATHRRMNGMASHEVADKGVLSVGRASPNLITWVKISQCHVDFPGLEVRLEGVSQKRADIIQLQIT